MRAISWFRAARKAFDSFPADVRQDILDALAIAAEGAKSGRAKPLHGLGSGVFEIALQRRGDAYRGVYAVQVDRDVWVLHVFQKKSKSGIGTPKEEIDLVRERLKRLKESLP